MHGSRFKTGNRNPIPCYEQRKKELRKLEHFTDDYTETDFEPIECQAENEHLYEPKLWTYDDFCYCVGK